MNRGYLWRHEGRWQTYAHHLGRGRRLVGRHHRPNGASAPVHDHPPGDARGCGARGRDHAGARRAADRGDGGLWGRAGAPRPAVRWGADWGTGLGAGYVADDQGVALHVWVDETRPRNQGAALTAWELGQHGVPHTVIADNTGGHLMQHGMVDMVVVGADRVAANGDVCNKIGTYLKALAAKDNGVPFYVGLPSPTIDFSVSD